jgi:hypothetical protein
MGALLISCFDLEAPAVASGTMYAVLFRDSDNKALDFAAGTPDLQTFDGNHTRFGKVLAQHSTRTRLHYALLADGSFTLPNSAADECYQVEYWHREGGARSRPNDRLVMIEFFNWLDGKKIESRLGSAQEARIALIPNEPAGARYEALASLSYDQENNRIGIMAWLEKDGQLQHFPATPALNPITATVRMVDSTETEIFSKTITPIGADGQFADEYIGDPLSPDETYFLIVYITDADSVIHKSASSPVTWD